MALYAAPLRMARAPGRCVYTYRPNKGVVGVPDCARTAVVVLLLLRSSNMSIFEYNGAAIVAMAGKQCVAIGSDLRFGVQLSTMTTDCQKVYKIHDQLFLGLAGLASDAQTLHQRLVFKNNMYKLREERDIKPSTFGKLVSSTLYEKRFGPYFASPVIAGLEPDGTPYLCGMDSIGAMDVAKDFMVSGTAPESLYGMCESMWKADMEAEELFEVTAQCLLSGVDRDALSGWGAVVHLITQDKIITRTLKTRMD
jgi:20S proteasome subunit beta 3